MAFFASIALITASFVVPWFASDATASTQATASTPVVTNFAPTDSADINVPLAIVAGPDGNLWFTNSGNNSIGTVTTAGTFTSYTGMGISTPRGITVGSDHNLWFTNANAIGKITTTGTVTLYAGTGISGPTAIAAGPDGDLWFNSNNGFIGKITTGGVVTDYPLPNVIVTGIAAGPDGNLWFTNSVGVGRITTSGVITNYKDQSIDNPQQIAAGSDGALWFTNAANNSIGRITTGGIVSNYTAPSIGAPFGIAAGPDGALWFTESNPLGSIGRIATNGVVTNYTDQSIRAPTGITAGPPGDGALWFLNGGNNGTSQSSVGRITTGSYSPPTTSVLIPSKGATLSGTTATLDASASNATSVEFLLFGGTYGLSGHLVGTTTLTLYGWIDSWNTTTVPNSSYVLVSVASGPGGTTASSGVSLTVNNSPPTTSVLVPSSGATLSGTAATLDASASNATSVKFLLFGGSFGFNAPVVCTATATIYGWLCAWNTTTVPNGTYALVSEAFNATASAASSGVSITVKN
jgi:streptogramin lyase